ncbi:MAG: hypothetical protein Q4E62_04400, partial [Sutterellaceae bacterium]|nr:hypothetical protein [Sutterellaceae bacterium]
ALCPQAHLAAFRAACDYARGTAPALDTRRIIYEMIGEHLRFLAFDAPNSVGLKPDAQIRRLGALRAQLDRELNLPQPDYEALDKTIGADLEYFVTGNPCLSKFKALDSLPDFEAWMMLGATAASRLFAQLWEDVPCRKHTQVPVIDAHTAVLAANEWFKPGFSANTPKIDAVCYQTSAEARHLDFPLLHEISEQYGCGVRAGFAARLIDLIDFFKNRHNPQNVITAGSPEKGVGLALVQCARGTLTTRVKVENGILTNVQIIAPTEWNFTEGSAAQQALKSISFESEEQYKNDAAWVLAAVDPCVPYQIRFPAPETDFNEVAHA